MPDPLILYSTNSALAYNVSRHYYGDRHYVWCAPYFNQPTAVGPGASMPASSSPAEIYRAYARDIESGDRHSAKIQSNRAGILRGAEYLWRMSVINKRQLKEITDICRQAQLADFHPRVYVIPYPLVRSLVRPVPLRLRANPFSPEFIIESLSGHLFDIISF